MEQASRAAWGRVRNAFCVADIDLKVQRAGSAANLNQATKAAHLMIAFWLQKIGTGATNHTTEHVKRIPLNDEFVL